MFVFLLFRGVHSNTFISERLRADTDDAGHQQEVFSSLLPEPGARGRRGETVLQTTGT